LSAYAYQKDVSLVLAYMPSGELARARFVWPGTDSGSVTLTLAQVSMLLEGIDWRMPVWTARPEVAV
jgi:transposase